MFCACLGVVALIAFWGFVGGGAVWLLANVVLATPPPFGQAFWFVAIPATLGIMIGAKLGSKNVLDSFEGVEKETGGPVVDPRKREMATQAGSRAAAAGSLIGALLGGLVWFVMAL